MHVFLITSCLTYRQRLNQRDVIDFAFQLSLDWICSRMLSQHANPQHSFSTLCFLFKIWQLVSLVRLSDWFWSKLKPSKLCYRYHWLGTSHHCWRLPRSWNRQLVVCSGKASNVIGLEICLESCHRHQTKVSKCRDEPHPTHWSRKFLGHFDLLWM